MKLAVGKCAKWLLALVIAGTVGFTYVRSVHSSQDTRKAGAMSEKMKTVCAGRLLIDLPEIAQVTMKMVNLDGFEVTWQEETASQFASFINEREVKLGSSLNMLGRKNIELSKEIREADSSGKIFVHSRYRGYEMRNDQRVYFETVTIEGHINRNGMTYSFHSEGDDVRRLPAVSSLMAQLVSQTKDELPSAPGFCLDGALIADPFYTRRHESVTVFAALPGYPDITLAFWTNTGLHQGPGLIERDEAATDALTRARSRILRSGVRTIGGFAGEEVAVKTTELNFSTNFSFAWETGGSADDAFVPRLLLELDTGVNPRSGGKPVQSSLNEEMVIRLWDKISSSVRLRPIRPVEVPQNAPLALPLGIYVEAGERCPQSGWWSCGGPDNNLAVLGGQRQYFCKGQKLPQALLLPPQSLWQKVRGLQPSYETSTRTAWKLVDKRERDRIPSPVPLAQATLTAQTGSGNAIDSAQSRGQPGVPIGCVTRTGVQCPASGWWRCEESHALDGTRWFAAGTLLPAATFRISSTTFGRSFGKAQAIQRRSVWQLVRHAAHPASEPEIKPDAAGSPGDSPPPATT